MMVVAGFQLRQDRRDVAIGLDHGVMHFLHEVLLLLVKGLLFGCQVGILLKRGVVGRLQIRSIRPWSAGVRHPSDGGRRAAGLKTRRTNRPTAPRGAR